MSAKSSEGATLVGTGVRGLDGVLGGGLPTNRVYLVEGDPGTGKTTLALQVLLEGVRLGESVLYVTLSETREELCLVADSHGWDLDGLAILEMTPNEDSLSPNTQNTMFHPAELELGDSVKTVLAEVERTRPTRVVFDSLSELRLLAQSSLRYRRQILGLKHFFTGRGCTVLLLDDRTADGDSDRHLQSIVHGVISLERRCPEYGVLRRRLQVTKLRGRQFRAGFHDYSILKGGLDIYPRLIAAEHAVRFDEQQLPSGIAGLDEIMGGGIDRGTSVLFMGPPGAGKSALATQFVVAAADRGEAVACFSFEEATRTTLARADGLGQGLRAHVESGKVAVRQVDAAELSPGEFASLVRDKVETDGVRLVVIDSINGYLNAMPEARFLLLHLNELLTYLGHMGVTTLLTVTQQGMIGQMTSPVDVSYLADTMVLLRYFEAVGAVRQALSVVKKRRNVHERTLRELRMEPGRISVGQPLSQFRGVLSGVPTYLGGDESLIGPKAEQGGGDGR